LPKTRVKSGTAVDIVLVKRQASVEVPHLTGKSLDGAQMVLEDLHLAVGNVSREPISGVAQDTVLYEFPKSGKKVDRGTAIDLVVAQAQSQPASFPSHPPAPGPSKMLRVPNLVGMTVAQVPTQLKASGLAPGKGTMQAKAGVEPGIVLSQDRASGQQVQAGSHVNVTVSKQYQPSTVQQPFPSTKAIPKFSGSWEMFEHTLNGVAQPFSQDAPAITQNGTMVHIGSDDYEIDSAGTVVYRKFFAHDSIGGHEVPTEDLADVVNTSTWEVKDSVLVFKTIHDFRRQFFTNPPGSRTLDIAEYRRVAP
jgi:hypothetical protein